MILILEQTGLGKQCRPRSDDSSINILIGVDSFCHSIYIFWNVLLFSEIKIFRMSVFFSDFYSILLPICFRFWFIGNPRNFR